MTMTAMTIVHRLGIKHALLLRAQLGVERLDRLGTLNHPGAAPIRHGQHLVHALRRGQLFKLAPHRLLVCTLGMHTGLAGLGKSIPCGHLLRLELELVLQRRQMLGTIFFPLGVLHLPMPGFRMLLLPERMEMRPHPKFLDYHRQEIFKG